MAEAGFARGATFLSLDVEGAEGVVLATVDPSSFDVALIEHTPNSRSAAGVARLMRSASPPMLRGGNYTFKWNDVWLRGGANSAYR